MTGGEGRLCVGMASTGPWTGGVLNWGVWHPLKSTLSKTKGVQATGKEEAKEEVQGTQGGECEAVRHGEMARGEEARRVSRSPLTVPGKKAG